MRAETYNVEDIVSDPQVIKNTLAFSSEVALTGTKTLLLHI